MRHLFRAFFWAFLRLLYRIRVRGLENIPTGACILAPNHVTYIDAVLIAAHIRRPIHYAMYAPIFRRFRWLVEPLGAFPIAGRGENPGVYEAAFLRMEMALHAGEIVCIFPEGRLTADGELWPFQPGIKKLLSRISVPVVPVGLRNLWGSYFSRKKPGIFKLPDHFMAKITMVVGEPISPNTPLLEMQQRVRDLVKGN